jgi:3-oxoacyl-[acyl-carrier protein] reductase
MELSDRVVIVTGSSSGVGAATAVQCARRGAKVAVNYNGNAAGAEATAAACRDAGGEAIVVRANVADDDDCRRLAAETLEAFGAIDGLVNNAGTTKFCAHQDLDGLDAADFHHIYGVNTIGPFQMTRACAPHMKARGEGAIVNVASVAGVMGVGSSVAYAASKGALVTMTLSLARVLGPEIRVNAVCPGFIQGDWLEQGMGPENYARSKAALEAGTPLKATADADTVAECILYFLEGARLITGETLMLDAGMHLNTAPLGRR